MKKYILIILSCMVFMSCHESKYEIEISQSDNNKVVFHDTITSIESQDGVDTKFNINIEQIQCDDTILTVYTANYSDRILGVNNIKVSSSKLIYFSKIKYIKSN